MVIKVAASINYYFAFWKGIDHVAICRKMNGKLFGGALELESHRAGSCLLTEVVAGVGRMRGVGVPGNEAIVPVLAVCAMQFNAQRFTKAGTKLIARKPKPQVIFGSFRSISAAGEEKQQQKKTPYRTK